MATPAAANKGPRTAINRHSRGTSSRHESDATVTSRQLPTSTGASGGAIVPTAIPADSTTAHRSSLTGALRSRSGPALDGGKGLYLLQRSRSYAGNLLELIHCPEFPVVLPVVDDAPGRRGPDLWKLVELLHVGRVYVYPKRTLRLVLDLLQRGRIDDRRCTLREPRRVERAAHQYDYDCHRHDHPGPVTPEGAGRQSPSGPRTTRRRFEEFVPHTVGNRTGRRKTLARPQLAVERHFGGRHKSLSLLVPNLRRTCSMASGLIVMSPLNGKLRAATVKRTRAITRAREATMRRCIAVLSMPKRYMKPTTTTPPVTSTTQRIPGNPSSASSNRSRLASARSRMRSRLCS